MKFIMAVIKPFKFEEALEALMPIGVEGMTRKRKSRALVSKRGKLRFIAALNT
jgi:nitrogen regulatory protein PII